MGEHLQKVIHICIESELRESVFPEKWDSGEGGIRQDKYVLL